MLWDTHLHTYFSGDSEASPKDMIESAIKKGLSGICFTDHMDLDYREDPGYFDLDFSTYKKEISLLQEEYADIFPIYRGVELGLQPHITTENNQIISENDFDFVIGSTHVVNHIDIYYPAFYEGREEDDCYRQYFEETLQNVQSDVNFDVYGHLDYVIRYGVNKDKYYSYKKFSDVIDEILRTLITNGKGIEINTAGFKYGLSHAHPTEDIIKRYKELGGEIITLGSDGHTPEHIAWDFHKIPEILKSCGFEYFTVFKNRKPKFIKLP